MADTVWLVLAIAGLQAGLAVGVAALLRVGGHRRLLALASLALAWLLLQLAVGVLGVWPVWALLQTNSLTSALALSLAAGLLTLGLQRIWPNWAAWQRDAAAGWPALDPRSPVFGFWRSALAAAVMLALALPGLLLATGLAPWQGNPGPWLAGYLALSVLWHVAGARLAAATPTSLPTSEPAGPVQDATLDPDSQLLQAAQNGQVDLALQALEAGANAKQLPIAGARDQRSLMMVAATLGDLRLLRALIGHGVDVNAMHGRLNPLLCATRDSWHGRAEAVTMLLANGARTEVADADGNRPLHHAMRSTDPAVAALLLDAGAEMEAVNAEGFTPLALACQAANWRLARYMLERKAKIEPEHAEPVLLAAAGAEDDDIGIRLLHKHRARIDVRGKGGRTALMTAAQAGLLEVVAALLELGAQVNAEDEAGQTAYMLAAQAGEVEVLRRLQQVPKLNRQALDTQGKTALDHALANGRWSAVAAIDPEYPLPEHLGREPEREPRLSGSQQLFHILEARDFAAAAQLLDAGLAPDGHELAELMFSFCQQDNAGAVQWLRARGAHLFSVDAQGRSVYQRLLQTRQNPSAILTAFMASGQSIAGSGTLALYLAFCLQQDFSRRADEQTALQLLQQGADPFGHCLQGAPPLVLAVRLGWQRLVQALLALGVDANSGDGAGQTALHHAAQLGRTTLLRELLAAGADPDHRAANGQTPFGLALLAENAEAQQWLDWPQWRLPMRRMHSGDLCAAVLSKDLAAVRRLLALAVPVNGHDGKGSTALIHACGQGQTELVPLLLAHGAQVDLPAGNGVTPLWAAISQGHDELVRVLLAHGADSRLAVAGYPPLILACRSGRVGITGRLLEHGAEIGAADPQAQTALHAAAAYLASDAARLDAVVLIDSLIRAGAEVASADKFGQTAMHLLCGAGLQKGQQLKEGLVLSALERLLQEHPDIDALDARAFTALHHAAARGFRLLVLRLLQAGADRQRRDNLGRSAYDFAVMGGFSETADALQARSEHIDSAGLLMQRDQG